MGMVNVINNTHAKAFFVVHKQISEPIASFSRRFHVVYTLFSQCRRYGTQSTAKPGFNMVDGLLRCFAQWVNMLRMNAFNGYRALFSVNRG